MERYLADGSEYMVFLDVGSTLIETRQEPSSWAHGGIRWNLLYTCKTSLLLY